MLLCFICSSQSIPELEKKFKSYMMTSFRIGIGASRIAEVLNHRKGLNGNVGCMFLMQTGDQATVSSEGFLVEKFLKSGKIKQFPGFGTTPKRIFDREFKDAQYRFVRFDETNYYLNYDSQQSTVYFCFHFMHVTNFFMTK